MTGTVVFPPGEPTRDVVTAVLVPADPATRRRVTSGVRAKLWDGQRGRALPDRLVTNRSGALVLLNRPLGQTYTFQVDPTPAGYRGPFLVEFQPQQAARRRVVWLESRPDSPLDPGTTVVRGVVRRIDGTAAAGLRLEATREPGDGAPPGRGRTFGSTTDRRGSFAVVLRLVPGDDDDADAPVETALVLDPGGQAQRELVVHLHPGRHHVFAEPLDLDGHNQPQFTDRS